jgi:hypothetical protein
MTHFDTLTKDIAHPEPATRVSAAAVSQAVSQIEPKRNQKKDVCHRIQLSPAPNVPKCPRMSRREKKFSDPQGRNLGIVSPC